MAAGGYSGNENSKETTMWGSDGQDWSELTPAEEQELAEWCQKSLFLRKTKKLVEDLMREKYGDQYRFKLDNCDFLYNIADLELLRPEYFADNDPVEFEITQYKGLEDVVARPIIPEVEKAREDFSVGIKKWFEVLGKKRMEQLKVEYEMEFKELAIVKWPNEWMEIFSKMDEGGVLDFERNDWWDDNLAQINYPLNMFREDYEKYAGKHFRASFVRNAKRAVNGKVTVVEMFLVDLGISTLIPMENVYRMAHRFMIGPQLSSFLSVKLDLINQYSDEVNEKWKYLLQPGMKIKAQVVHHFDEILIVKLVEPSEDQFNEHFETPSVQTAIKSFEIGVQGKTHYKMAKKMSVGLKGTFPKHMEQILAEETAKLKLQEEKKEYIGIGRVHPAHVFNLEVPNPVPKEWEEYRGLERKDYLNMTTTRSKD